MPMLAERRRKSKWTLNPGRRALWNIAESSGIKFGQGLMEKMGWRVGQGLGVNEQGMTEPLRISTKTDSKGIGFKNTDSIEWVQQQNDFNELLEKLSFSNGITENSACNGPEATKIKIRTSLEEKSKHSKTRVHYHKFTRGKDLTKYSDKDLECIVGSKKELLADSKDDKDKSDSHSKPESDQSIINAGSMVDYFSKKLQKKQSAGSNNTLHSSDRRQEFDDLHGSDNKEPEDEIFTLKEKKRDEKEIKSHSEMTEVRINDKERDEKTINHYSLDTASNFTRALNKDSNHRNKYLNSVRIEDSTQDVNNERNGVKSYVRDENNFAQNFSGDNSEYRHFKKLKKKRRKERETKENDLLGVGHSEKEVTERLEERKLDNKRDDHSEDILTPRKKDGKKEKVKENIFDCYDSEEYEKFSHGKRKKMDDNNEEVSGESKKKKRKENADKTENNVVCGKSITNEEVEHCKVLKPRKKEKRREKVIAVSRNVEDDDQAECTQITDFRKVEDDFGNDEVRIEEGSKPQKSKKRREKATEIRKIIEDVDRIKCEEVTDHEKDKDDFRSDEVDTKKVSKFSKNEKRKEISNNIDGYERIENEKVTHDKTDEIYSKTCQVHSDKVFKTRKQKREKRTKKLNTAVLVGGVFPGSNIKKLKGYGYI